MVHKSLAVTSSFPFCSSVWGLFYCTPGASTAPIFVWENFPEVLLITQHAFGSGGLTLTPSAVGPTTSPCLTLSGCADGVEETNIQSLIVETNDPIKLDSSDYLDLEFLLQFIPANEIPSIHVSYCFSISACFYSGSTSGHVGCSWLMRRALFAVWWAAVSSLCMFNVVEHERTVSLS